MRWSEIIGSCYKGLEEGQFSLSNTTPSWTLEKQMLDQLTSWVLHGVEGLTNDPLVMH